MITQCSDKFSIGKFTEYDGRKVAVLSDMISAFSIDERYTGKWYPSQQIELVDVDAIKRHYWTFPTLRTITNHRRLLAMFWMPYNDSLRDMIIHAQQEFYICHNREEKRIALPVRVEKDTHLDDSTPPVYRLQMFTYPTFAFVWPVIYDMTQIFQSESVIEVPANPDNPSFIHPISFYVPGDRGRAKRLVQAFEFMVEEQLD